MFRTASKIFSIIRDLTFTSEHRVSEDNQNQIYKDILRCSIQVKQILRNKQAFMKEFRKYFFKYREE